MSTFLHLLYKPLIWIIVLLFILIYPMLISIYVFLPLLMGVMGYVFIRGLDEGKMHYLFVSIFYFINLEINLSLPLFLSFISFLIMYIVVYKNLYYFRNCRICQSILSVIFIDLFYVGVILIYDFVFQTTSIVLDNLLLYSLIVDIILVIIL